MSWGDAPPGLHLGRPFAMYGGPGHPMIIFERRYVRKPEDPDAIARELADAAEAFIRWGIAERLFTRTPPDEAARLANAFTAGWLQRAAPYAQPKE